MTKKPKLTTHALISQPCASCDTSYKVLKEEAHWRNLCPICYRAQKAAQTAAENMAAKMTTRVMADAALLALHNRQKPTPKAPLWTLAYAAPPARSRMMNALDEARRDLLTQLDRAEQGDGVAAEIAAKTVRKRVLDAQRDQRRVWLPYVLWKMRKHLCLKAPPRGPIPL